MESLLKLICVLVWTSNIIITFLSSQYTFEDAQASTMWLLEYTVISKLFQIKFLSFYEKEIILRCFDF